MMTNDHIPQNVNVLHQMEQATSSFNRRLAVMITTALGTMPCAYFFMILAILGFPGLGATPPQYVQWVSQTFIQLVALSVLAVGQNEMSRHQAIQADEEYKFVIKSYEDTEAMKHDIQDIKKTLTHFIIEP